jgi:hypothetical protein
VSAAAGELAKRVDVDLESFEIRDGRLYLFYRNSKLDARILWLPKAQELINKTDSNWPTLQR